MVVGTSSACSVEDMKAKLEYSSKFKDLMAGIFLPSSKI
jgi:hypothetical protein